MGTPGSLVLRTLQPTGRVAFSGEPHSSADYEKLEVLDDTGLEAEAKAFFGWLAKSYKVLCEN